LEKGPVFNMVLSSVLFFPFSVRKSGSNGNTHGRTRLAFSHVPFSSPHPQWEKGVGESAMFFLLSECFFGWG
jgi:hypothetical protein